MISLRRVMISLRRVMISLRRVIISLRRVIISLRRVIVSLRRVIISLRRVIVSLSRVIISPPVAPLWASQYCRHSGASWRSLHNGGAVITMLSLQYCHYSAVITVLLSVLLSQCCHQCCHHSAVISNVNTRLSSVPSSQCCHQCCCHSEASCRSLHMGVLSSQLDHFINNDNTTIFRSCGFLRSILTTFVKDFFFLKSGWA